MIWFRRILTIPFIIIFFLIFLLVLVITQINDTAFNPGFYIDQLRQGDVYNFIYADVVPQALDEIETDESSDFFIDYTDPVIKQEITATAEKILPPAWIEEQVETAINTFSPYFLGDTDEFTYTFIAEDRVRMATKVLKEDTLQSDTFSSIYDDVIIYLADMLIENLDELPFTIVLSNEEVESALKTVAAENWIKTQLASILDSITPYIVNDSDHFTITIPLNDRVDTLAEAFIDLLSNESTYNYLLDEMITPMIQENLNQIVNLSFDVSFTQEEISTVVKETMPQSWVQEQLEILIYEIAAYAKGETDTVDLTLDLTDRKEDAVDALTALAEQKLRDVFYTLPTCSMTVFLQQVSTVAAGNIPSCRPSGISYDDFLSAVDIDIAGLIEQEIIDEIPDQWVYTEEELRDSLGEQAGFIDDARTYVSNGWTYTDEDLLEQLEDEEEETLNDARDWIESGYTVTEEDLREAMEDEYYNDSDIEAIDNARHGINTIQTWIWALYISPFLTLISIGFMAGRNWWGRAAWGLSVLFFVSLIIFIAANPIYTSFGEPELNRVMIDPSEYEGLEATMIEKGVEMIYNAIDAFLAGIATKTLYMMIVSGVILLGIFTWTVVRPWHEIRGSSGSSF